jgi:lipopolysaccharide biosynthesis regulator YciM
MKKNKYEIITFNPETFEKELEELGRERGIVQKHQEIYQINEDFFKTKIAWLEGLLKLYDETGILEKAQNTLSMIEKYKSDKDVSPETIVKKYETEKEMYKAIVGIYRTIVAPYLQFKENQLRKKREEGTEIAQDMETKMHGVEQFIEGLKRADP